MPPRLHATSPSIERHTPETVDANMTSRHSFNPPLLRPRSINKTIVDVRLRPPPTPVLPLVGQLEFTPSSRRPFVAIMCNRGVAGGRPSHACMGENVFRKLLESVQRQVTVSQPRLVPLTSRFLPARRFARRGTTCSNGPGLCLLQFTNRCFIEMS